MGRCELPNEAFPSVGECCNNGGTRNAKSDKPIAFLDGAKSFSSLDFAMADGSLPVLRQFNSRPFAVAGNTMFSTPVGFANWRLGLLPELQLGDDWTSGLAGLTLPDGGYFRFVKSGAAMVPEVTSTYPVKQTQYTLAFVGAFPATNAAVKTAPSSWILTDAQDRTWYLSTRLDPITGKYDVARPDRMVEPGGLEYHYDYAGGLLLTITDSLGRALSFEWVTGDVGPSVISKIELPDGTTLNYTYEPATTGMVTLDRLAKVERRSGATVLDATSYDYGAASFPTYVTGVRDKDNVLRWSVAYDAAGRATSSSGPGGVDATTVAYGAAGSTFTRTVTTPLGKSVVYTYARTSSNYDLKLTSIAEAASPNSPARTETLAYASGYIDTDTDGEGRVTKTPRDTRARPTQVVEAQGTALARTTTVTWQTVRNLPAVVSAPGLDTTDTLAAGTSAGAYAATYLAVLPYAYSGAAQTYVVPAGASGVTIDLWGGAGGNGNYSAGAWSGAGGQVRATFTVTPGDTVKVEVGGGGQGAMRNANGGAGGWPDGGPGGRGDTGTGGGGGSTRFYINGVLMAVAGGGGGSGGYSSAGQAGAGGGLTAQAATGSGGRGGSQTAGGVDGSDTGNANKTGLSLLAYPGAQRTGGWGAGTGTNLVATSDDGGGGGGGYWGGGGGGGDGQSGGGGSSWIDASSTARQNLAGNRQTPARQVDGLPALATGVNSAASGPAIAGGDGYAILRFK